MLQCLTTPTESAPAKSAPPEDSPRGETPRVRAAIQTILAGKQRTGSGLQRRQDGRVPFPHLIRLIPVGDDGATPAGPSMVVVGKHLSPGGIDFYHRDAIPQRLVIAWIESPGHPPTGMLLELSWCRFNKQGWYDSGGRFLRVVDSTTA